MELVKKKRIILWVWQIAHLVLKKLIACINGKTASKRFPAFTETDDVIHLFRSAPFHVGSKFADFVEYELLLNWDVAPRLLGMYPFRYFFRRFMIVTVSAPNIPDSALKVTVSAL